MKNKSSSPLTKAERDEMQILEYIATNTPEGLSAAERARYRELANAEGGAE